jgi:sec-independent protein translocase protein TatC
MRDIYDFLAKPLLKAGSHMIATSVVSPFMTPAKVTLMVAFLIALPYVLWQLWAFIAPGLYKREKRLVVPVVVSSVILFYCGMAFVYFVVFPFVFKFLYNFTPASITMATDIDNYWSFVLSMFLAFGLAFETPIVVVVLTSMGIVTLAQLKHARPFIVVGAFVVAAIFTPPDVTSQLCLAIPLLLLFELGILMSKLLNRAKEKSAAEAAEELQEEQ